MNRLVYGRFGSRTGFVQFYYHRLLFQLGRYRKFSQIRPGSRQRLVFICSGNICRSPLAEVFARSLGKEAASCGLSCRNGFPADPRAKEFAQRNGLSLEAHETLNVQDFEFRKNDLIVVMEPSQIPAFHRKVGAKYELILAGSYCKKPNPYIHDPYNCNAEFFTRCEQRVIEAVRGICG